MHETFLALLRRCTRLTINLFAFPNACLFFPKLIAAYQFTEMNSDCPFSRFLFNEMFRSARSRTEGTSAKIVLAPRQHRQTPRSPVPQPRSRMLLPASGNMCYSCRQWSAFASIIAWVLLEVRHSMCVRLNLPTSYWFRLYARRSPLRISCSHQVLSVWERQWPPAQSQLIIIINQSSYIAMAQSIEKSNLFLTYLRSLIEHECAVDVELKNNALLTGKLSFVDNNMCLLLHPDEAQLSKFPPQFAGMSKGIYVRGSAVRMAFLPKIQSDLQILSDLCKKL